MDNTRTKLHERKWIQIAALITAVATLLGSIAAIVTALGLDELIVSTAKENTTQIETAYKTLQKTAEGHAVALNDLVDRVAKLEEEKTKLREEVAALKDEMRFFRWTCTQRGKSRLPPEKVEAPRSLLSEERKDKARAALNEAGFLPDWEQVQERVQVQIKKQEPEEPLNRVKALKEGL